MINTFPDVCIYIGRKVAYKKYLKKNNLKLITKQESIEEYLKRKGKITEINIKTIIANDPDFYTNYGSWRETDRNNN